MALGEMSLGWVVGLSNQERLVCVGEKRSLDLSVLKKQMLADSVAQKMQKLDEILYGFANIFNRSVKDSRSSVELSSLVPENITLKRRSYHLHIKSAETGINICCEKVNQLDGLRGVLLFSSQVEAMVDDFYDVHWRFLNSEISAEQIAKYYFTELIQISSGV